MANGFKSGGRQKGTPNKKATGTLAEIQALVRKAKTIDRKTAKARAARRRVGEEYKAAAKVLAPTLDALKAAVSALEALIGSGSDEPAFRVKSSRHQAAALAMHEQRRAKATATNGVDPSNSPPPIREVKTIMFEDGVNQAKANRIQEQEILARADWQTRTSIRK